jgi:peroxiredoxin
VVAVQAKQMERTYRVVWGGGGDSKEILATHGQPFTAPLLSGGSFDFGTVLGRKPVLLTFWASWCKPCLTEAPHVVALHGRYAKKGVAFLAVSIDEEDDYEALRKVATRLEVPYPVPLDPRGEVLAKYAKGASIPLTFVLDGSGRVRYSHRNFETGDEVDIEDAMRSVLADAPRRYE